MPDSGYWTTDDLDALPEDGRRRELIDGVLIASPSPRNSHQALVLRLGAAMLATCPAEFAVSQGVEVRISRRRALIPDLMVLTAEAAKRDPDPAWFAPHEVVLAVEIESPSSVTFDRVTKPALYAQAGIPYYWRIAVEHGIEVVTHRLDPAAEVYRGTGTVTGEVELTEPWPMRLNLR
jgi:Uma2 family endonuclease